MEATRRRRVLLWLLVLAAVCLWGVNELRVRWNLDHASRVSSLLQGDATNRMLERRRQLCESRRHDETGFERLGAPREGEWLHRFPEPGETADEYRVTCRNRRTKGRETIHLRPLGPLSPRARALIEPVRKLCGAFFAVETTVLPEQPLPATAFHGTRDQYDTTPLLELLKAERGDDALMHAGLADKDLFTPALPNFVFGIATLSERVGVYSFARFAPGVTPEATYRRRAFKLVAHELGHILSLEHCVYYRCVMNGSNSLPELDGSPLHDCPVCHDKLAWNLGFDPIARAKALAAFYEAEGLSEEAAFEQARAARSKR